jgi:hypothetical protein
MSNSSAWEVAAVLPEFGKLPFPFEVSPPFPVPVLDLSVAGDNKSLKAKKHAVLLNGRGDVN